MMLKVLWNRLQSLGRGEEGVALVVTLGVFMFLYVVCASVYSVGMAVKERMLLQRACDAAAYSAAIVQADTFSRIATINRAMSWTYQQMTRRQMDYIVWKWLQEVVAHYEHDKKYAESYAAEMNRKLSVPNDLKTCELGHHKRPTPLGTGQGWNIGEWQLVDDVSVFVADGIEFNMNSRKVKTLAEIKELINSGFPNHLKSQKDSFYSKPATLDGLGSQIEDDLRNIKAMNESLPALANGIPQRVNAVVDAILKADVPGYFLDGTCRYRVEQCLSPRLFYFEKFRNNEAQELIFLSLGGNVYSNATNAFGRGSDKWFRLDHGKSYGFHRLYEPDGQNSPLLAKWFWYARGLACDHDDPEHQPVQKCYAKSCKHVHAEKTDLCCCDNITSTEYMCGYCYANNETSYGNRKGKVNQFEGTLDKGERVWATPLKLTKDYFGRSGTITVVAARRSENPWFSLFGRVTGGIYSAFSPLADSWSFCFASAKAGYKIYHVPKQLADNVHLGHETTVYMQDWEEKLNGRVRVFNGPRDYCIDWKDEEEKFNGWEWKKDKYGHYVLNKNGKRIVEKKYWKTPTWRQSWNLVQDDWDAVMVPVRQGGTIAREHENYSLQEWGALRHGIADIDTLPYRHEPIWMDRNDGYIASLAEKSYRILSGSEALNTALPAGPTSGDSGDVLNGRLIGQLWEAQWRNGTSPSAEAKTVQGTFADQLPTSTGTNLWNIGNPGHDLDWNKIGAEMYH